MYTGRVKNTSKYTLQEDGSRHFDVELEILEGEEVKDVRRLSFPLDTSEKEIKEELKKYLETYNSDAELAIKNVASDAREAKADKVAEKLTGEIL
ncbi:hypothetical protein HZB78_05645 [Candidatus Collierbacteria bacterium]|nr:hypothetical protein [Candidatus Collierbacteria bacterium]